MSPVRALARPLLATYFVWNGVRTLRDPDRELVRSGAVVRKALPTLHRYVPQVPDDARTVVRALGGAQLAAGLALATGRAPRLSSLVLAASLAPAAASSPVGAIKAGDAARDDLLKDVSLLGGLLIAGVDRPRKRKSRKDRGAKRAAKETKAA